MYNVHGTWYMEHCTWSSLYLRLNNENPHYIIHSKLKYLLRPLVISDSSPNFSPYKAKFYDFQNDMFEIIFIIANVKEG